MPSHASSNPEIKQLHNNGHFCYAFKFGLGIIRHISFITKTLWCLILILLSKRNPASLMRISVLMIQSFWFRHQKTSCQVLLTCAEYVWSSTYQDSCYARILPCFGFRLRRNITSFAITNYWCHICRTSSSSHYLLMYNWILSWRMQSESSSPALVVRVKQWLSSKCKETNFNKSISTFSVMHFIQPVFSALWNISKTF